MRAAKWNLLSSSFYPSSPDIASQGEIGREEDLKDVDVFQANMNGWNQHGNYWRSHGSARRKQMLLRSHHYVQVFSEIEKVTGGCSGKQVADVGCAAGTEIDWMVLSKGCSRFIGIDISTVMLHWFKANLKGKVIESNVDLVLASAESLPFHSKSFDAIMCIHTLHHCPSPSKVLHEMNRAGKCVVLLEPNRSSILHKLMHSARSLIKKKFSVTSIDEKLVECHDEGFTQEEILAVVEEDEVYVRTVGIFPQALIVPKILVSFMCCVETLLWKMPLIKGQLGSLLIITHYNDVKLNND